MQAVITHNNRQEPEMKLKALVSAAIGAALVSSVASAAELRLSHQWSTKDVRHKVAEIVANHVKDANVDLEIKIFPSKSLFKPKEQYKPLSRGQLDALNVLRLESLKHLYGPAKAKVGATKLVCGIGTGFNIAAAYPASKGVLVPPAEAGHVRLPVATPIQRELSDWITSERGFASVETVLAGNGLETLNRFFDPEHPRSASEVMQAAQDGQREARQVVTCFASVMGSYFGDLALAHLPLGGIYMIGGVSRAIAPYVTPENFGATFHDKGVFSDYMSEFPIFLVEDDFAALKGCLGYLQQSI